MNSRDKRNSENNTFVPPWCSSWFNSPYYHLLYQHRDCEEARQFIDHLLRYLNPPPDAKMLDLCCGRGRHAIYLHSKGYDVTGIDLSPESIFFAKKSGAKKLRFCVHDMRKVYKKKTFDYVFNFFTSFGYFEGERDNLRVVMAAAHSLKPGGVFVIDFLNAKKAITCLVAEETLKLEGITFKIQRRVEDNTIIKNIEFSDKGENYCYEEKVRALQLNNFKNYFRSIGFELRDVFGDYRLSEFDENNSERLIMVAKLDEKQIR